MLKNTDGSVTFTKADVQELVKIVSAGSLAVLLQIMTDKTMPEKVKESGMSVVRSATGLLNELRSALTAETVQ